MLGCGLAYSQMDERPSYCEEEKIEPKEEQNIEDLLDNFEELSSENKSIKDVETLTKSTLEIMNNEENKFVFFFNSETTDKEYLKKINSHGNKMKAGLDCK